MRAAVEGRAASDLKLLAVTVLTSLGREDLADLGYTCEASELVATRTCQAVAAGMDGIVTSPLEVAAVREIVGPDRIIVAPGVRSVGAARGDQKRVATPAEAIRNGANYVVIGRQITRAEDPAREAARVLEEIAGA
jgi:orotidine-5'-phosphate decarboxylase